MTAAPIPALMPIYARNQLVFERGQGAWIYDTEGRRYLDFASGIAVSSMGHAHPHLIQALTEQAGRLWHTSNLYRSVGQEQLAERLIANSFADTAVFTNSGAEAWEAGVKLIRKHFHEKGMAERYRIITMEGCFHGRTTTGIAASKAEKMVKGFGPLIDSFDQVAFGNLNELRAAITPQTAAINLEPILGEGGIKPASLEYLRAIRQICDEFGLLLFLDEIQTGMGRTGRLFAHEWAGIVPDVMCLAKGIGGGFPLGACLATADAAIGMVPGTHGSTYAGNPLAMAVGNAVLDILLAPGFLEQVDRTGRLLWGQLQQIAGRHTQVIAEVRGAGLMLGLRCVPPMQTVLDRFQANGLIGVAAADNTIRLLPPLIIGEAEIEAAVSIINKTCSEIAAAGGA